MRAWLLDLTEQVSRRLRRQKQQARTVHLKVRFADFRTISRSRTLSHATDVTDDIWQAAKELLSDALPANHLRVRLLGNGVSGFGGNRLIQQTLFDKEENEDHTKQRQLDAVTDAVREKFGGSAMGRGSGRILNWRENNRRGMIASEHENRHPES